MWSKENAGVVPEGPADVAALPFVFSVGLDGLEWKGVMEKGSFGLPEKTLWKVDRGSRISGRARKRRSDARDVRSRAATQSCKDAAIVTGLCETIVRSDD